MSWTAKEVTEKVERLDNKHEDAVMEVLLCDPNVQRAMKMRCDIEGCWSRHGIAVTVANPEAAPDWRVDRSCEWCGR